MRLTAPLALTLVLLGCGGEEPVPPVTPRPSAAPLASASASASGAPVAETPPPVADPSLPPRNTFFGNPDRSSPQLSPDGKQLAWLAPHEGVMNVFVAPAREPGKARVVTKEKKRGVRQYAWPHDGKHLLYLQDDAGDENFHLYAVDLAKADAAARDLTPYAGARAELLATSHKRPGVVLVGLNDRDKRRHDAWEVELATGKRKLVAQNDEGYQYVADLDLGLRLAAKVNPDATTEWLIPDPKKKGAWKSAARVPAEDLLTTGLSFTDKSGKELLGFDSRGRDKSALVRWDPTKGGAPVVVGEGRKADVKDVLTHPKERTVQAYAENHLRRTWTFLDKAMAADFEALAKVDKGEPTLVSRSLDDATWVVAFLRDDGPVRYHVWDRKKKAATFLFSGSAELEKLSLRPMHPREIQARDGLALPAYLTLPAAGDADRDGTPEKRSPLVLFVHGGPWARDQWGYNPTHQWLASRGYAVLSVNYRGSTGFGKKFINAADKEWAGKMHDDLVDAVRWAVAAGVADEKKVAIYGGSYGGYSALVGLTFTPKQFTCAVDIVGPSNLVTLLQNAPAYWAPFMPMFSSKLADHATEEGKKWLLERSPLTRVTQIERPLLIGQGANDPRVKQLESDQIVKAMKDKGIPVTYVLYPDEGHGFARPENRKSFNAIAEIFLAQCLGGPYQPVGDDFAGSSLKVPEGAAHVHGLPAALPR